VTLWRPSFFHGAWHSSRHRRANNPRGVARSRLVAAFAATLRAVQAALRCVARPTHGEFLHTTAGIFSHASRQVPAHALTSTLLPPPLPAPPHHAHHHLPHTPLHTTHHAAHAGPHAPPLPCASPLPPSGLPTSTPPHWQAGHGTQFMTGWYRTAPTTCLPLPRCPTLPPPPPRCRLPLHCNTSCYLHFAARAGHARPTPSATFTAPSRTSAVAAAAPPATPRAPPATPATSARIARARTPRSACLPAPLPGNLRAACLCPGRLWRRTF